MTRRQLALFNACWLAFMCGLFFVGLDACSSIDTSAETCNPFTQQRCPDFHYADGGVRKGRCCPRASTCTSALPDPFPGGCLFEDSTDE